jgi:hypothetical protein
VVGEPLEVPRDASDERLELAREELQARLSALEAAALRLVQAR